jgi:hypothetical protein
MFCPKCRCEYRPGFTRCADCDVPLVEELPSLPPPEPDRPLQKWELDRRDSLNIAFVKGAFVGYACGEVIRSLAGTLLGSFLWPVPFGTADAALVTTAHTMMSLVPPLGLLIGGLIGRNRRY